MAQRMVTRKDFITYRDKKGKVKQRLPEGTVIQASDGKYVCQKDGSFRKVA